MCNTTRPGMGKGVKYTAVEDIRHFRVKRESSVIYF